jgi:hypothetical protein
MPELPGEQVIAHLQNVTAASVNWYQELIKASEDGAKINPQHGADFIELATTVAYVIRLVLREYEAVQLAAPEGANPLIALNLLRTIGESSLVSVAPEPRDASLMISGAELEQLISSPEVVMWIQ